MIRSFHFISFLVFLTIQTVFAQEKIPIDPATGKITYSETVKVDSVTADDFCLRIKTWVVENFDSYSKALQKDDRQNGLAIIKGTGNCYKPKTFGDTLINGWFTYTLTIEYKDGSYKYTLIDFYSDDQWKGSIPAETYKGSKKQKLVYDLGITEVSTGLITSLKLSMGRRLVVGADE